MNRNEVVKVLAKIQLGDNRAVDALVVDEWEDTIGHLRFDDAIQAVRFHRQESTAWLMPAHVIAGARRATTDRNRGLGVLVPTGSPIPANWAAMLEAYESGDSGRIRHEREVYHAQLRAEGITPENEQ